MTDTAQRLEDLRLRMRAAPPNGMTAAQVDAWFASDRERILAEIVASARGHAYRVGADWFVDAGVLESAAANGSAFRTPSGWAVAHADVLLECERIDASPRLPGQRGVLYRCLGGQAHAEQLIDGRAALLTGAFETWRDVPRASACVCKVTSGPCGCSKKAGTGERRVVASASGELDHDTHVDQTHDAPALARDVAAAEAVIDGLDPDRRALLCCLLGTSDRARLARLLSAEIPGALANVVAEAGAESAAVAELIRFRLHAYVEKINAEYRGSRPAADVEPPEARRLDDWTASFDDLLRRLDRGRTRAGGTSGRALAQTALRVGAAYRRQDDPDGHNLFEDLRAAYRPLEDEFDSEYEPEEFARLARDLIMTAGPAVRPSHTVSAEGEHGERMRYWLTRIAAFLQRYPGGRLRARRLADIALNAMGRFDPYEDPDGDDLWHAIAHESYWINDVLGYDDANEGFADLARDLILRDPEKPWKVAAREDGT